MMNVFYSTETNLDVAPDDMIKEHFGGLNMVRHGCFMATWDGFHRYKEVCDLKVDVVMRGLMESLACRKIMH